jgi:hypothetical protein
MYHAVSSQVLAAIGHGRIAYIRRKRSEEIGFLCPDAPMLAPGHDVFVLYGADGAPLLVTDTHEAALANAEHDNLETVPLH